MFLILSFLFFLLQNQITGEQNKVCLGGGLAPVGGERWWKKGVGG
jgi:hypothetical protein